MHDSGLRALALPTLGRVLELAPLREDGMPDRHGRRWHQLLRSGDALPGLTPLGTNDVTGFEEVVAASSHLGCHIDAPGQRIVDGHTADGTHYARFYGNAGLLALGAEELHPVVTRGVLCELDDEPEVDAGDAVLIRTRGGQVDTEFVRRLADRGAVLIGLDAEGCELDAGVPVVSNLLLDELAAAASGPFLFVMAPIRGAGSTGAPASPLAIL
jgi:kynurenine formamidase